MSNCTCDWWQFAECTRSDCPQKRDALSVEHFARQVIELAQLENTQGGAPGYWVPAEAIDMLRARLDDK